MNMGKVIKVNGDDLKTLLRETIKEVMGERSDKSSIKVFLSREEISFLEDLLNNLDPDNTMEDVMIKRLRTSLNDAQINL